MLRLLNSIATLRAYKTYTVIEVLRNLSQTDNGVGADTWFLVSLKFAQVSQQIIVDDLVR